MIAQFVRDQRNVAGVYCTGTTYESPFEWIELDIFGPLPKFLNRNKFILVLIVYFTKWLEAYPIPDQGATTTTPGNKYGITIKEIR